MRGTTFVQQIAVVLALAGMCAPQMAFAATPQATPTTVVTDVRLHESGALLGQVVSPENIPLAGAKVTLLSGGKPLAVAQTNQGGCFAFPGVKNGVYELASLKGHSAYRVWTPQTAPPSAHVAALVVDGDETVRGQNQFGRGFQGFRNLMANPWFVAAVIAAAVAIPVAIHNSKKSGSP